MSRIPLLVLCAVLPLSAAEPSLSVILRGIENRYNRARTLQVKFEQSYTGQSRARKAERGELFLRKPGRMRWEYSSPPGKLFVIDGKHAYLYTPSSNQVEKTPVRETDDMRAPLAFLLGKLDFDRDFKRYIWRKEGDGYWIGADPKSDRAFYSQVEFFVNKEYQIQRLIVTGADQSVMDFRFANEVLNPRLREGLFTFRTPEGAAVVETSR